MDFQNTDEVAKREACERVKQIVKAIKAIKIKYYLNFSKISAKDQETYQKLETNLDRISKTYNLQNLKVALMSEVEARYNGKNANEMGSGTEHEPNDTLQACYGAVDAEIEALSKGRITQALRCQEQLKKYRQGLDAVNDTEITNYKREKLAELGITKEQVEEQIKSWKNNLKGMYKIKDVTSRKKAMDIVQDVQIPKEQTEKKDKEVIELT